VVALTEMTNWAVDLIDVRKTYGRSIHALRGVNIQVGRGEIFGLLGPNGAGKSTLVKIMMTVVRPTHALGTVLGRPLGHRGKLARAGYLPENHRFPPYLTGARLLDYYAALARVPRNARRANAARLLDRVGMTQWADTRIDKYSKGMMQRLGIAQALMNDPELVVLDEPTDGLDPVGRREVRQLLAELRGQGKTIFLNSHLLSELEMVCDRVSILVNGLVARAGTLRELTERTIEYRITFAGDAASVREKLERIARFVERDVIAISGGDKLKVNDAIDLLRGAGALIESVLPHRFSLEDVLVEAVGKSVVTGGSVPVSRQPG
jgi:ABC-2 type transport system ATP-binding protein